MLTFVFIRNFIDNSAAVVKTKLKMLQRSQGRPSLVLKEASKVITWECKIR